MNDQRKNNRPVDPYEEQYRRQLEQFSRIAGDDGGDVDLQTVGIDDAFADEYPSGGTSEQDYYGGGQSYERPRQKSRSDKRKKSSGSRPKKKSSRSSDSGRKKSSKKKKAKSKRDEKQQKRSRDEKLQFGGHKGGREMEHEKSHPIRSFFRTVITLLLVAFIGLNLLLYYYIGMVNVRERGTRTYTGGGLSSPSVTNILLIGSDTRSESDYGRTDSMILLSVNSSKKTITMTSFMRDMYVEIKGRNHNGEDIDFWDKLNAAYVYGGPELLMDTIEYNFDVSVDDYVYIDFFAFVDIVDAIGGIEVDVTDAEAEGMKPPMYEQNKILGQDRNTDILSHGGKLNLNGNQALAYARLRYVGNADFQRTERQREVIGKIINKVKKSDPLTINRFMKVSLSNLSTNMGKGEMMLMAYRAIFSLKYEIKSLRLPADNTFSYGTHGGQSTLDVDLDACRELLKNEIYS